MRGTPPRKRWLLLGLLAGLAAYEADALLDREDGDTISASTRALFRTNTPAGKAAWLLCWGGFSAVFAWHIATWSTPNPRN